MRLNKFVIALLILIPVIGGYFWIEKAARDGIAEREATERYLAANPPPKPVEIKIEGCPPGSWNTKLFGHVFVLDTHIEVPCSLSNGKYYLIGRQFSLRWSEALLGEKERNLSFSVLFEGTPSEVSTTVLNTERPPAPIKGLNLVKVNLSKSGAVYFDCGDTGCRGWAIVSRNFKALINVHSDQEITPEDLKLVVDRVFSRIQ